jgi:DNA-binding Lrp family transcriptional regulator
LTGLFAASTPAQDSYRLAMRLSAEYLLRGVELRMSLGPGDLLGQLIEHTMVAYNTAAIDAPPPNGQRHVDFDDVPPDHLRIPINIKTLAAVLHMPFETVRRRVKAMVRNGLCVQTKAGVYIPAAIMMGADYRSALAANQANVRRLYQTFRQLKPEVALIASGSDSEVVPPKTDPVRLVARFSGHFGLSLISLISGPQNDPVRGMILATILVANTRSVSQAPDMASRYAAASTPLPDMERIPVSVSAVASSLQLPFETARRRVNSLIEEGLVIRERRGVYIQAQLITSPVAQAAMATNFANLQRLYTTLAQYGVRFD